MSERLRYQAREPKLELGKKLMSLVWVLTAVVLGLVIAMRRIRIPLPEGWDFTFLPAVNAGINSIVALLLVAALISVLRGRIGLHQKLMTSALALSVVFLLCYVAYHITTDETKYGGEGLVRGFYYFILITHVILAAVSFPFILRTFVFAITNQFGRHRALSRRLYPVWLYVAITGPVVYFMLRPYY